jgi:hypothetical protein
VDRRSSGVECLCNLGRNDGGGLRAASDRPTDLDVRLRAVSFCVRLLEWSIVTDEVDAIC